MGEMYPPTAADYAMDTARTAATRADRNASVIADHEKRIRVLENLVASLRQAPS